jgi:hypothetical protein
VSCLGVGTVLGVVDGLMWFREDLVHERAWAKSA